MAKLTILQMLAKLDCMYQEEEKLCNMMTALKIKYEQLQEDKELLKNMIMYASNKASRKQK